MRIRANKEASLTSQPSFTLQSYLCRAVTHVLYISTPFPKQAKPRCITLSPPLSSSYLQLLLSYWDKCLSHSLQSLSVHLFYRTVLVGNVSPIVLVLLCFAPLCVHGGLRTAMYVCQSKSMPRDRDEMI